MATTGRIVYHGDDETIKKEKREFSLTDEIMELINSGGGGGAINGVKVNGQVVNPDGAGYVGLTIPGVINNLSSNSTSDALSAKQGKVLYEYIQALQHVGHFLALWNTATGLPVTNPETSPYTYNTGDYYIVSNVAAVGGTNYKPNGSSYTINVASTTVESGDVQVNDIYFYDGYERRLLDNSGGGSSMAVDSSLSTTSTNPVQNAVITNRLNQMALDANTKTFWLSNLQDTTTAQAIRDWVDGGGNAIVFYNGVSYYMTAKSATRITLYSKFTGTQNSPSSQSTGFTEQLMWIDNDGTNTTVSNMTIGLGAPYLATNQNYSTVYTPLYDGSPATKKYVDDKFSAVPTYSAGTGISITSNTINNTGVTSVNGSNGAVTVNDIKTGSTAPSSPTEGMLWYDTTNDVLKSYDGTNWNVVGDDTTDINTKTFFAELATSGTGPFTDNQPVQDALDWYLAGNNPIIITEADFIGDGGPLYQYPLTTVDTYEIEGVGQTIKHTRFSWTGYDIEPATSTSGNNPRSASDLPQIERILLDVEYTVSGQSATVISCNLNFSYDRILTAQNTGTYTPTGNYNPATKKYVDDKVSGAISTGSTAPSNPTEGQLWYDTTNDELKVYNGTTWNVTGGGIKLAANSPLTVTEIWAGTESEYNNLSSKGATTAYLCVEE